MAAVESYLSQDNRYSIKVFCAQNDIYQPKLVFAIAHASRMKKIEKLSKTRQIIPMEDIQLPDHFKCSYSHQSTKYHDPTKVFNNQPRKLSFSTVAVEKPPETKPQSKSKKNMEISVNDDIKIVFSSQVSTVDLMRIIDLIKEF